VIGAFQDASGQRWTEAGPHSQSVYQRWAQEALNWHNTPSSQR